MSYSIWKFVGLRDSVKQGNGWFGLGRSHDGPFVKKRRNFSRAVPGNWPGHSSYLHHARNVLWHYFWRHQALGAARGRHGRREDRASQEPHQRGRLGQSSKYASLCFTRWSPRVPMLPFEAFCRGIPPFESLSRPCEPILVVCQSS